MITIDVKGLERTRNALLRTAKDLKSNSEETLEDVARFGFNLASLDAPEWSGATKASMSFFPESKEAWIIKSSAPVDHPTFPVNVFFDDGDLHKMNWSNTSSPRKSRSVGFMRNTARTLESEFARRLNLAVSTAIER